MFPLSEKWPLWLSNAALAVVSGLFLVTVLVDAYTGGDMGYHLALGERLIDGETPFVDFVDVNPPMIVYLNAIPAYFAQLTGVQSYVLSSVFFVGLLLLSLTLCLALLKNSLSLTLPERRLFQVGWLALGMWTFNEGYLGQREHLIFIFLVPMVVLRVLRGQGYQPGGGSGVCCRVSWGIGFLPKATLPAGADGA